MPAEVARRVRRRCGFGCVVCGSAIYQYEHFDPTFAEATTHDPDGITLLCGACHDRRTRGLISEATVEECNENPKCQEEGFSWGPFDVGGSHPAVHIGTVSATNTRVILRAFDDDLLTVSEPEIDGGPFRLSAFLADRRGRPTLEIKENQWFTPTSNWDVEVKGQTITIRSAPAQIDLRLKSEPPDRLIVERLSMSHRGARFTCDSNRFEAQLPTGRYLRADRATIDDCEVAIGVTNRGIYVGKGGGSIEIGSMEIGQQSPGSIMTGVRRPVERQPEPGRNDPCPCGSGKKYKKCCGRLF